MSSKPAEPSPSPLSPAADTKSVNNAVPASTEPSVDTQVTSGCIPLHRIKQQLSDIENLRVVQADQQKKSGDPSALAALQAREKELLNIIAQFNKEFAEQLPKDHATKSPAEQKPGLDKLQNEVMTAAESAKDRYMRHVKALHMHDRLSIRGKGFGGKTMDSGYAEPKVLPDGSVNMKFPNAKSAIKFHQEEANGPPPEKPRAFIVSNKDGEVVAYSNGLDGKLYKPDSTPFQKGDKLEPGSPSQKLQDFKIQHPDTLAKPAAVVDSSATTKPPVDPDTTPPPPTMSQS